jgi:hypothetical protein
MTDCNYSSTASLLSCLAKSLAEADRRQSQALTRGFARIDAGTISSCYSGSAAGKTRRYTSTRRNPC